MKNNKIIIIGIVVLVVVAAVAFMLGLSIGNNVNDGASEETQYSYIAEVLDNYNKQNEATSKDVILLENDTQLAFMINDFFEAEDGNKETYFINYTEMQITNMVYDKDLNPLKIISMDINDTYTVRKVSILDCKTQKITTYEKNDKEIEEYQKKSDIMSNKIKEIFNETSLDGISLFYKTVNDVKVTK